MTRARLTRRELLLASSGLLGATEARRARADVAPPYDEEADVQNLRLLDRSEAGRRYVVLTPRYLQPGAKLPVVVLLHGLGETMDPRLGAYAWLEKYGLGQAWQRLMRPPLARTSARGEWTDERLAEVNASLAADPFRGFVMICPHMPNPKGPAEVGAYASWLTGPLLAKVRAELPEAGTARDETYLAGVSLGGWVSLEVLVRAPETFSVWAGVQTAIGTWAADGFVEKIARAPVRPRAMLVLTSTQDHWRASSEALASAFRARKLACDGRTIPGPHDQPWLREAGTIETLLWLDRQRAPLAPQRATGLPTRDTERPRRTRGAS